MNLSKNIICLILFLVSQITVSIAQTGEWTWMNGDNFTGSSGVYGIQGVPAPLNTPPSFYEATEWTDKQGNFWLFGGAYLYSSDLWKYDPTTNMWTWIKGPGTGGQSGIYGTQGVSAPANNPGGRMCGSSWVDTLGNLWLFGGYGYDAVGSALKELNDLWKYDIALNEWVWMKGSNMGAQLGTYGSQGTPAPANTPGGRLETSATWVDDFNNLWIFGGQLPAPNGFINDLWKYNIATNEWTWMKGSNAGGQNGVYGTKGVSDPNNTPGGRRIYTKWKDLSGNFWIFSGQGHDAIHSWTGNLNDLWKYNLVNNEWTWMGGADTIGGSGVSGSKCVPSVNNIPSARMENRACWTDSCGNFWTFGGIISIGFSNELWHYNPITNEWIWVSGDSIGNSAGVYGTKTVSDPTNIPGARYGSVGWMDKDCNIWLFGGTGFNDLWRYVPDSNCPLTPPLADITVSPDTFICSLDSAVLSANGAQSYTWTPATGLNSTTGSTVIAKPTSTTTYTVTGISGCHTSTATVTVTILPAPEVNFYSDTTQGCEPLCINYNDSSTFTGGNILFWNWDFGDGGTSSTQHPNYCYTSSGSYDVTLTVTSNTGCISNYTIPNMINVLAKPVANFTYEPELASTLNPLITFKDASSGANQWFWNFGDSTLTSTSTLQNPMHLYGDTGIYCITLRVNNSFGCIDSVANCLVIDPDFLLYIPNAFTPTDEGNNDNFISQGIGISKDNFEMLIFNRWGELIYETNSIDAPWNGKLNNTPVPEGVYIYAIELETLNGKLIRKQGTVMLIR